MDKGVTKTTRGSLRAAGGKAMVPGGRSLAAAPSFADAHEVGLPHLERLRYLHELEVHQAELEEQNQELQRAWEHAADRAHRLELAVKELESFSYAVSHDLRAPLRHINGYLSILSQDFADEIPDEARHLLDRTCQATRQMSMLIDGLLELAKVSRSKINSKPVDLSRIAREILERLAEDHPARQVEVVVTTGLLVSGDQALLSQMMWNLLENAWKYTAGTSGARIEVGRKFADGKVVFFVRDNGAGFDPSYTEKLFIAFNRLHGKEFEGNGIGLATVKRIIDRHQGAIWAESELGRGAAFLFTLP